MTTSRIPIVIDALVATLDAALPNVRVFDGQWVTVPASTSDYITIGWTPDLDGPSASQEFVGAATTARNEHFDIPCYADAYSGSTDTASRRNAAFALLAAAENALRASLNDPAGVLGGAVPQPGWLEVGSYTVRQEQAEGGLDIGITFHIIGVTRI